MQIVMSHSKCKRLLTNNLGVYYVIYYAKTKLFRSKAIFITILNVILIIVISVLSAIMQCLCNLKTMAILQQNHYYISPTIMWVYSFKNKSKNKFCFAVVLDFLIISTFVVLIYLSGISFWFNYLVFSIVLIYLIVIQKVINKTKLKKPLVVTNRIKRLMAVNIFILTCCFVLVLLLGYFFNSLFLLLFLALNLFSSLLLLISSLITIPLEELIKLTYILKAKQKLKRHTKLIIVGVTGSYGKTSTKNFLETILKQKYSVLSSPNSFNTPMGVTKTILEHLKPHHEILILEMGADHKNDIKKLCKIASPDVCVITAVGMQHLKTFKTFDNIIKTKFQIVVHSKPNAMFVTNLTNTICLNYFKKATLNKFGVGFDDNAFCTTEQINLTETGMELGGKIDNIPFNLKTKLLGSFNAINIMLAMVVAYKLGVSVSDIEKGVKKLEAVKHRLELKKINKNILVIDDSFNSNPIGAKTAVETLSLFNGKKIIITCGMVELGEAQFKENYNFGKLLCNLDEVLVVNNVNYKAIADGVVCAGGKKPKLFSNFINAYNYALSKSKEKTIILIENDLTDSYI